MLRNEREANAALVITAEEREYLRRVITGCMAPSLCEHGEQCPPECERDRQVQMCGAMNPRQWVATPAVFGPYPVPWWRRLLRWLR